ncbi:FAD-dependent oxidoreductase [Castellaniella caeni]|uniref:FAD-dependent oxidoreductase n=1 Tax=Castellaniella caeni TaxID=266123 RepID=UPI00082FF8E2|nr:FAD-dependent oxidoreductase [Castellaniella caeni]
MTTYDVKLISKREVAEGTMEFTLEKPADLTIRAGQFCDVKLPSPEGTPKHDAIHGFSFVNAAFEPHVVVATRMRGTPFKEAFKKTPDGTMLKLIAPFGDFTLHKNEAIPAVFIIGGIGITPVRSMVVQALHDKTAHQMTLIYANRTRAQAAYTDEFTQLAAQHANFTFVPVYTDEQVSGAEHGRVNADIVRRHVSKLDTSRFYLSGPEGMVKAMRALLVEIGADEDNIRTEEFEGY